MNVMIIAGEVPSADAGGIGTVVYHLQTQLENRGITTELVSTDQFEDDSVTQLAAPGPHPIQDLTFGRNFRRYVKSAAERVDVFHFHLPNARGPLLFAPSWVRERSVVSFHTTPWGYQRYLYDRVPHSVLNMSGKLHKAGYGTIPIALERRAVKDTPALTAVSTGVASEAESAYGVSVDKVVHNGIDPSTLPSPCNTSENTVLFVGRLVAQKGLSRGLEMLDRCDSSFEFRVAGTGVLEDRLTKEARQYSFTTNFLGFISEEQLLKEYANADLLFMPSYYEGLPMVGIEGAGSGLPLVATDGARVEDIVCDKNSSYLSKGTKSGDAAQADDYFLSNPAAATDIGNKNRTSVATSFTAEQMTTKYQNLYTEIKTV